MAQSYTRQSTFADGDTITATLFNNEYNQLANVFAYSATSSATTGHRHDGTAAQGGNIPQIGDLDFKNKIVVDSTNNRWGVFVEVSGTAVEQIRIQDGAIVPVTDSDIDLGTSSLEFKDLFLDGTAHIDTLDVDVNATVAGTLGVTGVATLSSDLSVGGNLTVTGNATIAGNLTFGDAASDTVAFSADVASNLLPSADNTYDLGASGSEWKDLYIDGTANIDSLVADTADINGGTIDGATIATSDITVGSGKTLNVSAGTLTLADDQISGDKVEGGTIAATTITTLTSTTGNITSVNATTVDTTNLEVTTLKAKDGTAAGSIADSTGIVTVASSVLTTTDINGGTIDGVTIGGSSAGDITYANLSDGTITITAFVDEDDMSSDSATLVPTQQSVKAYVDAQVTAQDFDFQGDTGGALSIDLDSETMTFTGGTGIDTSGSGNAVTFAIDSTVTTLTGSQTLTNKVLTSPDINTPDIDGGTIDGAVIGGSSAAAITGTVITGSSLDISGDADIDGTLEADAITVNGTALDEVIADTVGAMVSSNTETNISVTYDDSDNTLDFVIGTLNQDTTGNAATATALETARTIGGVSFDGTANITPTTFTTATFSGDVNVDSGVLFADVSANRVGINQTSPDVSLDLGANTDAVHVPVGTTAQRPGSAAAGYFRYNTSLAQFEGYTDAWGAIGGGGTNTFTHDVFTCNGSTTAFALSQSTESENNLIVFIDGVFQEQGAYSIATSAGTTTLTLSAAPVSGRKLVVYSVAAGVSGSNLNIDSMTGDGSDTTLTLSINPVNENNTQVFIDGVYQSKSNYSISGTTLTFSTAPPTGSAVEVMTMTQTEVNVPVDGTITSAKLSGDLTLPGSLTFADSEKAIFGAGSDLQIYHDGDHSYIADVGAGDLILQAGNDLILRQPDGSTEYLRANEGAGVQIYHNGSQKFLTTATGIDVTGVLTADGLTLENSTAPVFRLANSSGTISAGGDLGLIEFYSDDDSGGGNAVKATMSTVQPAASPVSGEVVFKTSESTGSLTERLRVKATGIDVSGAADATVRVEATSGNDASLFLTEAGTGNVGAQLVYDGGDNKLHFKVGNNTDLTRMIIDRDTGNVSIGTTTSNSKLNVASSQDSLKYNEGITVFRSTGSNKMFLNCVGGGANIVGSNSPITFNYHDQTTNAVTEAMRIDSSRRVGIGMTANTGCLLNVNDHIRAENSAFLAGRENAALPAFAFHDDTDTGMFNVASNILAFSTAGSERMRITSAGALQLSDVNSPNDINTAIYSNSDVLEFEAFGTNGAIAFSTGSGVDERMRIDASGNVGIGRTDPSQLLEVHKSTGGDQTVAKFSAHNYGDTGKTYIEIGTEHGDGSSRIGSFNTSGNKSALVFEVHSNTSGSFSEAMRLDDAGNLLVGVSAFANNTLGVAIRGASSGATDESIRCAVPSTGSVLQIGFYNGNGRVGSVSTSGSATAYNTSSDQRLKENIVDADDAGSKIDAIQVRKFDWKADGSHQDYGMVAQELQAVAPEAVSAPEDSEEMMGVDYSKLVPMMLKEIQSLRARIAALES